MIGGVVRCKLCQVGHSGASVGFCEWALGRCCSQSGGPASGLTVVGRSTHSVAILETHREEQV